MKTKILKFLYTRFRETFHSFMVEETVGIVPANIKDSSAEFFKKAGMGFEKFLMWHAYLMHKKLMDAPKKAEFYEGVISNIRYYQLLCAQGKMDTPKKIIPPVAPKKDPHMGVKEFMERREKVAE